MMTEATRVAYCSSISRKWLYKNIISSVHR